MESEPQENSDLLTINNKSYMNKDLNKEANGNVTTAARAEPPDGGFRAYSVLVGSFLTNGLLFGVINSYSAIYGVLVKSLKEQTVANAESRASVVGSLTMGTTFFLSPLSGILTGFLGLRMTAVLGGTIASAGLLLSSFAVNNVNALCFTYGIMYGLGAALAYTPSLAILGHYFKKHLGLMNGIVTVGSSVFTVFMTPLMTHMIDKYGLEWNFRLLALFTFGIALCGLLFKPIPLMDIEKPLREDKNVKSLLKTIVNIEIWRNMKYRLWALSMPVALFGYFVPYIHIKKFIENNHKDVNVNLPLQCIATASGVGRLIFGYLADKPGINRILLQQISFYVIGALTIILPFVGPFPLIVVISLGMGIFDGAFIALIGPIAIELCGSGCAAQAIGCMLGLAAAPLTIGPPVAGWLYEKNGSYTIPFVLAGISPLVGASLMFAIRFHRRVGNRTPAPLGNGITPADIEKPSSLLQSHDAAHTQTAL